MGSLQAQAQQLATQITSDAQSLDQLDNEYLAAQIHLSQLNSQETSLKATMARTGHQVSVALANLKYQAIQDYLTGGAPLIQTIPDRPGLDPTLTVAYASIIAGAQKQAAETYKRALAAQAKEKASLDHTIALASITLADVHNDYTQASATLRDQQQALSQVKGQMAVEVAAIQSQQQQAAQTHEESVLGTNGQLPGTTTSTSTPPATTSVPTTHRTIVTPAPTTVSPTTTRPPATTTTIPSGGGGGGGGGGTTQAPGVNAVLAYARAQLGKPYQFGAAGPNTFDCSGLVMMAWEQAGIYMPHYTGSQYADTTPVTLSQAIPGDLVFFGSTSYVEHVGIYIGNDQMIDAPTTGQDVSIQSILQFEPPFLGIGRVTSGS